MNRRNLLKTLGISAVGIATVPLWMDSWTADALPAVGIKLSNDQQIILEELVGVIIPATEIPGAKELKVDKFIVTMVADCYDKESQTLFLSGFNELDYASKERYGKKFIEASNLEQTELSNDLLNLKTPGEKRPNFISFVKNLTISGYMSSEYVLQNVIKYEFIPSRFNGSFPVKKNEKKV